MNTSQSTRGAPQSFAPASQSLLNRSEFVPRGHAELRHELNMLRYTNWALFSLLRAHLTYGTWDNSRAAPRINFAQVFSQPNFLVPASVQKTWEVKYNAKEGRSWSVPAPNRYALEKAWDRDRTWDPPKGSPNDLLKAVMKVPQAKTAQNELTWKVQVALDHAWHHNASKWPEEPDGYGIKFPVDPSKEPATGSAVGAHVRRHMYEFVEDDPNRAILLMVAVGYTGYVAGMHFNPAIPQLWPDIPLAVPGTKYRIPGMSLRINYLNDFRGTATRPLEVFDNPRPAIGDEKDPQEFRATIQVDVNEFLRAFGNEF